jgi:phenylalanyl-tRNA synthetase alpha chain
MQEIAVLSKEALSEIASVANLRDLDAIRVKYLGKNGSLTAQLKQVGKLSSAERPIFGEAINQAKVTLQQAIEEKQVIFKAKQLEQAVTAKTLDITLPGRGLTVGRLHPITQTIQRIQDWFTPLGFVLADGPEIESDYYNFEALNIPSHHPARAMHDTFYFDDKWLLRTHTSTVQIRYLKTHQPPCRMLSTGRVYRCDSDMTHTPMFHQIEGMMIDTTVHMGHLKGLLESFLSAFFERPLPVRFRSSYFPFTEPSAEVDIQCVMCSGSGCRVCKDTGWLEILGCGMMHPHVLEEAGINPKMHRGLAFGMGVERLAMLRHGIPDLRLFFENDLRFLGQFS